MERREFLRQAAVGAAGLMLTESEKEVVDTRLAFVLCAMVGHLFGYEAALSIDAQARVLREAADGVHLGCRCGGGQVRRLHRHPRRTP